MVIGKATERTMALCPKRLLSKAARVQCLANIKEIPSFKQKDYISRFWTKGIWRYQEYNIAPDAAEKQQAAVLVPLCVINDEVCLLYTLRSSRLTSYSRQICFPGGKRDRNENVLNTALRETAEEIGFPRKLVDIWAEMNPIQGRDRKTMITPVVGQLQDFDNNKILINRNEVEEVIYLPIATFCDENNYAHSIFQYAPLPVYVCGKHKIWGITALITHLFLSAFLPSDLYNPLFMKKLYKVDELKEA